MSEGCQGCAKHAREVKDLEKQLHRSRRRPRLRPKAPHGWVDVVGAGAIVIFLLGRAAAPGSHALIPPELSGCPTHPTIANAPQRLQKALGSLWGTAAAGFTAGLAGKALPTVAIPASAATVARPASTASVSTTVSTGAPGGIPAADWQLAQHYGQLNGVDPRLLVAIGFAETNWGKAGDGRNGNILGFGSFNSGSVYTWAGVDGQLKGGAAKLAKDNVRTIADVYKYTDHVGGAVWATDPGWASNVRTQYARIGGGSAAATFSVQPVAAKCVVLSAPAMAPAAVAVPTTGVTGGGSTGARGAVAWELSHLGIPYGYGSNGPSAYDCSSFTQAAYRSAGISIPRTADEQMHSAGPVPSGSEQPGDLAFPKSELIGGHSGHVEMIVSVSGTGLDTFSSEAHTGTVSSVDSGSSADFVFGRVT